jgi:hypothetical protein
MSSLLPHLSRFTVAQLDSCRASAPVGKEEIAARQSRSCVSVRADGSSALSSKRSRGEQLRPNGLVRGGSDDAASHTPRSAETPLCVRGFSGAHDGIRTRDLFLTKEVLYRLSYMGPDFVSTHGSRHDTDYGAGNGIRTRDPELGRLALYQLSYSRPPRKPLPPANQWWRGEDSNLRRHKPADLQSAPFGHSGTSPLQNTKNPLRDPMGDWTVIY